MIINSGNEQQLNNNFSDKTVNIINNINGIGVAFVGRSKTPSIA